MASLNKATETIKTHEGATAKHINAELQLRRSLMACMLWEQTFYESGEDIGTRIRATVPLVDPQKVADMAVEARTKMKLRHAPLLVARAMLESDKHRQLVGDVLAEVIQRPDELAEFLAIYWKDGRSPLAAQAKKGLARAFQKFSEYQLAKYNRDTDIKLRDVLFLSHAKPHDAEQDELWKRLIKGELSPPDTWEVALSAGDNKKEAWTRLLSEKKLGALALLRNLRNMLQAGVPDSDIAGAIDAVDVSRVLPFRFIAAARYAPRFEPQLEMALSRSVAAILGDGNGLTGSTAVLVDVSGSMEALLSERSEMNRIDAACGVAMVAREMCETCRVFTFSTNTVEVPPRRGFALRDAIAGSQLHHSTMLGTAVKTVQQAGEFDRLIVISDEQSHDPVSDPTIPRAYMINVASNRNGVGYGKWTHLDGFSESVMNYIVEFERSAE